MAVEWGEYTIKISLGEHDESTETFEYMERSVEAAVAALENRIKESYPLAEVTYE